MAKRLPHETAKVKGSKRGQAPTASADIVATPINVPVDEVSPEFHERTRRWITESRPLLERLARD